MTDGNEDGIMPTRSSIARWAFTVLPVYCVFIETGFFTALFAALTVWAFEIQASRK